MAHILLVEDDLSFSKLLETFLTKKSYSVTAVSTYAQAKQELDTGECDLLLSDMRLPDSNDLEIIEYAKSIGRFPIIMMTGYAEINLAVKAMQLGALDYLEKPIQPSVLLSVIEKAIKNNSFEEKIHMPNRAQANTALETPLKSTSHFIKGNTSVSKKMHDYIELVAPTPMSILIIGESGTGKENIAKTIHDLSARAGKPFIAVDCGAIPKELASSEFFGHIKGSFTGALSDKEGHFKTANGGTLFLDEIGNLSYELQVQLLRAIQERKIRPVGSAIELEVDIRIIAATNSNLEEESEQGNFREDLLYRLNEFTINVPPLRDRAGDLMLFVNHFIEKANTELNKNCLGIDDEVYTVLKNYSWPGNLRELQNVIKRVVLLSKSNEFVRLDYLPASITRSDKQIEDVSPLYNEETEASKIKRTLEITKGNKAKAAKLLQIDRKTLYNKLKRLDINL